MRAPIGYGKEDHFVKKGHQLRGVVHVGANDGEEISWYLHVGRTPVLAFEPQQEVREEACENYRSEIDAGLVRIEQLALGERDEFITLTVAANNGVWDTKGASALGPVPKESALAMGWIPPHTVRDVTAYCMRFDSWVGLNEFDLSPYNVLVVDVQGMEFQVLKGMGDTLLHFPYLMVECSAVPLWPGEAAGHEIAIWLADKGYRLDSPIVTHNDVFFIKESA
jgi:FkbM family methyltransferase